MTTGVNEERKRKGVTEDKDTEKKIKEEEWRKQRKTVSFGLILKLG